MPSRGPPRCDISLLEMLTKTVAPRATTATCGGCVQRGLGRESSFSRHGSVSAAEDDPRASILQLDTEGSPQTRSALLSS